MEREGLVGRIRLLAGGSVVLALAYLALGKVLDRNTDDARSGALAIEVALRTYFPAQHARATSDRDATSHHHDGKSDYNEILRLHYIYKNGLKNAPDAMLFDLTRRELALLQRLSRENTSACAIFANGQEYLFGLSDAAVKEHNDYIMAQGRAARAGADLPVRRSHDYLPNPADSVVWEEHLRRLEPDKEAQDQALNDDLMERGSDALRCRVGISMRKATLISPRTRPRRCAGGG